MRHRRPPRAPLFNYVGCYRYFVTCCVLGRRSIFIDPRLVDPLAMEILQCCERYGFAILAYVFMPDHVHMLLEGRRDDASFQGFMRNWRKRTGLIAQPLVTGPLWQDGYWERVLRTEEATEAVITYILGNPVRANLVKNATDYPFAWSIATHEGYRTL